MVEHIKYCKSAKWPAEGAAGTLLTVTLSALSDCSTSISHKTTRFWPVLVPFSFILLLVCILCCLNKQRPASPCLRKGGNTSQWGKNYALSIYFTCKQDKIMYIYIFILYIRLFILSLCFCFLFGGLSFIFIMFFFLTAFKC